MIDSERLEASEIYSLSASTSSTSASPLVRGSSDFRIVLFPLESRIFLSLFIPTSGCLVTYDYFLSGPTMY